MLPVFAWKTFSRNEMEDDRRDVCPTNSFTPTLILPPQLGGGNLGKDGFPFSWE